MCKKRKEKKLEHFLIPYTKTKLKQIKNLNIRSENIKLLDENIGGTFYDINHSNIIYDPPSWSNWNKNKNKKKCDLIKLKSFYTAKETVSMVIKDNPQYGIK